MIFHPKEVFLYIPELLKLGLIASLQFVQIEMLHQTNAVQLNYRGVPTIGRNLDEDTAAPSQVLEKCLPSIPISADTREEAGYL